MIQTLNIRSKLALYLKKYFLVPILSIGSPTFDRALQYVWQVNHIFTITRFKQHENKDIS